jgi:HAD superfamily phosphatase (TIGR01681 family)
MYESEVNTRTESLENIPKSVIERLSEYRSQVEARTTLPWGEHCTECASPSCYSTCELFEQRIDGACRQFVGGVVRIPNPHGSTPYLQKITFRRWAKLWALGSFECRSLMTADLEERINILVGSVARIVPATEEIKQRLLRKISYIRRRQLAKQQDLLALKPDYFVIEIYNPTAQLVTLTLSIRGNVNSPQHTFQKLIIAEPEVTRDKIPFEQISSKVDINSTFDIELIPNDSENLTLYFGLLDFVREREGDGNVSSRVDNSRKCKCVVWDLDNTLWNGILIEDGLNGIRLRDGVIEVIAELDRRGVLQSVASKNNPDDAIAALKFFGIEEYFLYPQIHWHPKSQSVAAIAKVLNIGLDTLVFVDDQEFERAEVAAALSQVRVIDATHIKSIVEMQAFQVTVTEESRTRRLMYRNQEHRDALQSVFQGDYISFLKANRMQVRLSRLT